MTDYLLGIDLGTSGVKALLLPLDGGPMPASTAELTVQTPRPGWSEQHPDEWWTAVCRAVRALQSSGVPPSGVPPSGVRGLALSGQMHGATLLDRSGAVIRPCMLWNDARSGEQCGDIERLIGRDALLQAVGNPALAGFTAPKLLWLRAHEPDAFSRIAHVLLPKDYINYRLTGQLATEPSDASGTLLFDVARGRWSQDVTRALDISPAILPPVHASTAVIGTLTPQAAAALGLTPGIPVVAGGADNACAAVGMGVLDPGQVLASLGTSGTLVAPTASPHVDPGGRLHTFAHVAPGCWYLMGVVLSAGGSLRWFRDTIAPPDSEASPTLEPYERIMQDISAIPPGSEGLVFLPYLSGERTPHGDPDARGVYFGLSLRHTRAHLARALVEGVSFALRDSAELMRALHIDVDRVLVTGGGSRSSVWRQILSDILPASLQVAAADLGPALGAAMIAGVGVGAFPTLHDAATRLVHVQAAESPHPHTSAFYAREAILYDRLYPALRPAFHHLAALAP